MKIETQTDAPMSRETINETISETIKLRPGISRADLIALIGRSRSTVARVIAELVESGTIERRGSKKTGGYYPKRKLQNAMAHPETGVPLHSAANCK